VIITLQLKHTKNGKFIFSDKETDLINRCISKDKTPQQTANIIERYFYIYNK
jgi:hypothetical protein